jgi:hypothetical protein
LTATSDEGHADDISADDEEAVEHMIHFIYLHDYLAPQPQGPDEDEEQVRPRIVVRAGQRRIVPGQSYLYRPTKRAPLSEAGPDQDYHIAMHARMYALGAKYGIDSLKNVSLNKFSQAVSAAWSHKNFVKAVEIVFTTTPDEDKGLRDIAVQMIKQKDSVLFTRKDMRECIRGIEGLAFDLLMHEHALAGDEHKAECESCGCAFEYTCDNCGEPCRCNCSSICELCGDS